jgi:hypothetical protein
MEDVMTTTRPLGMALRVALGLVMAPCVRTAHAEGPSGPPPDAYDACVGKSVENTCDAPLGDRTVVGSCKKDLSEGRLFCRPNAPPDAAPFE